MDMAALQQENERLRKEIARYRDAFEEVRHRLDEPEEIIRAIRSGEVDALVVGEWGQPEVYSVQHIDILHRQILFEAVLSSVQDYLYIFDPAGRFVFANKRLLDLWGVTSAESAGKTMRDMNYPAEVESTLLSGLHQVIETRQAVKSETVYKDPSGMPARYENILAPIFDSAGEVRWVAGSSRDITERKRLEEALKDADHRKDQFLAILAHELRNPLAPIRNATQLLHLDDTSAPRTRQATEMIDRQVRHMVRLIDDLLDISRITRGKLRLRRERTTLQHLVEQSLSVVASYVDEGSHKLSVKLPTEPMHLDADPVRLVQVLSNLLHNACKYTEPGGKISLIAMQEGERVVIRINDSGIGIAPDSLAELFTAFSQVESALTRAQGGLGLGLALSRGLVEMHGGSISASSAGLGKGSEFVVSLPLVLPRAAAPQAVSDWGGPRRRLRLLVVDDNRDLADSLADLMSAHGHQVSTVYDGYAALKAIERDHPDAVLLDIGLPGLDGYTICRRVRELPGGKDVRLIAQTGWGGERDRLHAAEAGFDGHVVKPVDPEALMRLLDN